MLWTAAVCVWMAEEPVSSEPVSGSNSLRSGKTTGIYAQERRRFARKSSAFQAVAGNFPNHLNREKNRANSESSETVRRQGFRDNGLGKLREALAHRAGEVRQPAAGAAS